VGKLLFNICLRVISSKDAYMLIYIRRSDNNAMDVEAPQPPRQASEYVKSLNLEHEEKCRIYEKQ